MCTLRKHSIFTRLILARYACTRMILVSYVLRGWPVRVLLCISVVFTSTKLMPSSCYSAVHSDVKYKVHINSYDTCQVIMIHASYVLRSAAARVPLCTSVVSVVYTTINSTSVHIIYSTQLMLYQCPCWRVLLMTSENTVIPMFNRVEIAGYQVRSHPRRCWTA